MKYLLPADLSLTEAHNISSRLESRLKRKLPDLERVVIHTEPAPGDHHPEPDQIV